jgi:hypothetical protein
MGNISGSQKETKKRGREIIVTKLGTNKKPVIVPVQTEARAKEIAAICD